MRRPLFLRIRGAIEVTMTFKQKKVALVAQGFDPAMTTDAIYLGRLPKEPTCSSIR